MTLRLFIGIFTFSLSLTSLFLNFLLFLPVFKLAFVSKKSSVYIIAFFNLLTDILQLFVTCFYFSASIIADRYLFSGERLGALSVFFGWIFIEAWFMESLIQIVMSVNRHKDTIILGKPVPAETFIFAQLWSVMKNDSVFEDSQLFNPDRYLHSNGETFRKDVIKRTIPFSIGKRNCIGEGLARMELFLIFSALIQNYEFVPTSNIDLTPQWSTVLTVKPYTCKIVPQF